MAKKEKKTLEQILLDRQALTQTQINNALSQCQRSGRPLKEVLISEDFLTPGQLAPYLAELLDIPYVDLNAFVIHPEITETVPEAISKKYKLFPLFKVLNNLTVAMIDPLDFQALDILKRKVQYEIKTVMADPAGIERLIEKYYGAVSSLEEVLGGFDLSAITAEIKEKGETPESIRKLISEAPVVKVVDLIIEDAVRRGASDIHIEPEEKGVISRLRIDGLLQKATKLPKILQAAVISRIKILAELDIAQKRIPQDGRIQTRVANKDIDLRVSTYPGSFGEDIVLRILDKTSAMVDLEKLGFSPDNQEKFQSLIQAPNGIILVTGPTGSGKTTTLYSALSKINTPERKIITIEDPIEYQIDGIRQSQINPKAGFTFSSGLRSVLRHDPDVIMVGEIRDLETAETAVQAALTGHLVFSTLHTNDAPSAATRLIDMGIEPFLITSSVLGFLAQRLVRLICPHCKEAYTPAENTLADLNLPGNSKFYRGKGCNQCLKTGYSGRAMVSELIVLNDTLIDLILQRVSSTELKAAACKEGMITMREDGINKVKAGQTTIEEILRVT